MRKKYVMRENWHIHTTEQYNIQMPQQFNLWEKIVGTTIVQEHKMKNITSKVRILLMLLYVLTETFRLNSQ